MKSFREFFEDAKQHAKETWEDGNPTMPTWIAEGPEGIGIYVTPWGNQYEKNLMLTTLKQAFKENNVFRYAHISEVWTVQTKAGEERPHGSLEFVEGREEALMVMCVDSTTKLHGRFMIVRDADGKGTLQEFSQPDYDAISGPLTELCEGAPVVH